jgi:NitT/TauT family transport system substrate-binding protein
MMRRFALTLALALLLPARAFAFTFIVTEPATPLVPTSVIELAQQLGYFTREGVDVKLERVSGTPMAIAALSAGQGDMAEISVESLLKLTARGDSRFRAVSSPAKSLSYVIAARDTISSLPELSEKVFGIGQAGTLDDTLSRTVLRHTGVDPAALDMVSVGHPQLRLKALRAGKIDATTISYASWMTLPDKTGLHLLLSKDDYLRAAQVVAKVNVVGTDALRNKRGEVVKVSAALLKLARDFARDPERWAAAMANARPDVSRAELQGLARAYAGDWCVDGCFEQPELEATAQLFYGSPSFAQIRKPEVGEWTDFSVLREVLNTIGPARAAERAER